MSAVAEDAAVLTHWWTTLLATGHMPAELQVVQTRLVRSVHRGALPSGEVFVKSMAFPRLRDRLRYLLRPLPAAHEAAVLKAVAAAGIRCPEVRSVHTARRMGVPLRSMLVLGALPAAAAQDADERRLGDEARLARRLLEAGIVHRDLHGGNFLRLADGTLAVLDLQSASVHHAARGRAARIAAACRLLRGQPRAMARAVQDAGLLRDDGELQAALCRAARQQRHYQRGRVLRCLGESTEFTRVLRWNGVEHRQRGPLPEGRWWSGGIELRRCWLGQRARQVFESRSPAFPAFFQKWWWLGGKASLYVPRQCSEDRIEAELAAASEGFALYRAVIDQPGERHGEAKD